MRILQLSTFDGRFGASIAARRLHEALLASGQESDLLVSEVLSDSPRTHSPRSEFEKFTARIRHYVDKLPLKLYPQRSPFIFSPNWVPSQIARHITSFNSDVVHMHWCQSNFVPTSSLPQLGRTLIWTFHDMWAFTGGCHYTSGCERYRSQCGHCPALGSTTDHDLSRWLWQQKQSVYEQIRTSLQIICPSNWLAGIARNAPLLEGIPVHAVPNPINTHVFKPIDKITARRLLGLPDEGRLLLWGATSRGDYRKGFDLLDEALLRYATQPDALPLGIVTLGMRSSAVPANPRNLQAWNIGFLHDEVSLVALYNAVDVVALPSREENLSNTLAEALCCGTPCLAFQIGGNADLISHQKNGYLAQPGNTIDMATGLTWILNYLRDDQRASIAREAQDKLAAEKLMPIFLDIYRQSLARKNGLSESTSQLRTTSAKLSRSPSPHFMELITHDPGKYHVSLDTVWEFEKTILEDSRVYRWNSKYNPFSVLPNLFWRNLYGVGTRLRDHNKQSTSTENQRAARRDMFAVLMGPNIRKTMPLFLLPGRKSIYLFDGWPSTHKKIRLFADSCKIDHLFLSSSQATKMLSESLQSTSCHWIPEGINPEEYKHASFPGKDIDVLQLGRRYDRYHHLIAEPLEKLGKVYLYEKISGQIIFPTRKEYIEGLARSKISICVPSNLTHPGLAGGIETMTIRYLQSMVSKCLIIGHAPHEMIELFGYNPVVEIDYTDPLNQILSILKNGAAYTPLIEKNYQTVLERHTWKHRWEKISRILAI